MVPWKRRAAKVLAILRFQGGDIFAYGGRNARKVLTMRPRFGKYNRVRSKICPTARLVQDQQKFRDGRRLRSRNKQKSLTALLNQRCRDNRNDIFEALQAA